MSYATVFAVATKMPRRILIAGVATIIFGLLLCASLGAIIIHIAASPTSQLAGKWKSMRGPLSGDLAAIGGITVEFKKDGTGSFGGRIESNAFTWRLIQEKETVLELTRRGSTKERYHFRANRDRLEMTPLAEWFKLNYPENLPLYIFHRQD